MFAVIYVRKRECDVAVDEFNKMDVSKKADNFLLSIVIPVFQEGKQIRVTIMHINKVLTGNGIYRNEFVLIDDGSTDNTWDAVKSLSDELGIIKAIRLSRNFGKEAAICAGLEAVSGNAAVVMDADLQHPPEVIPQMVNLWRNEGFYIVEGVKADRGKESLQNKLGALLFYKILDKLSGFNLNNASDFKLIDEKVIAYWKQMRERSTFFRGMAAWVGFSRTSVPFYVASRKVGKSGWSFLRLFKLAITAITSFSSLPLQIVTLMGILFLIGSLILGIQTLYMKLNNIAVSGFTTVILLQLIIGSALMVSLGIIGTYISRIFEEVKYRPRYIVMETIEHKEL